MLKIFDLGALYRKGLQAVPFLDILTQLKLLFISFLFYNAFFPHIWGCLSAFFVKYNTFVLDHYINSLIFTEQILIYVFFFQHLNHGYIQKQLLLSLGKAYPMVAILFKYYALQCLNLKLNSDIDILKDCQIGLF